LRASARQAKASARHVVDQMADLLIAGMAQVTAGWAMMNFRKN
jgi:hypothetical protein